MKSEKDNLLEQLEGSNRRAIGGAARGKTANNEEKSGKPAVMADSGVWGGCGRHGGRWAGGGGLEGGRFKQRPSPVAPFPHCSREVVGRRERGRLTDVRSLGLVSNCTMNVLAEPFTRLPSFIFIYRQFGAAALIRARFKPGAFSPPACCCKA